MCTVERGGAEMGVGMQIVYFGFAASSELEAEAGAQLVRLERYSKLLTGCHLAIEALPARNGYRLYDVRLELRLRDRDRHGLLPLLHCSAKAAHAAIRQVFDCADATLCKLQTELMHKSR
jgi:hypothetical protein